MANRHQKLIDEILQQEAPATDHSLRGKAMDRARDEEIPTTLTPWEWLEWYEKKGVPESHQTVARADKQDDKQRPWWRFWDRGDE